MLMQTVVQHLQFAGVVFASSDPIWPPSASTLYALRAQVVSYRSELTDFLTQVGVRCVGCPKLSCQRVNHAWQGCAFSR